MDSFGQSISQLLALEQQPCKVLLMELSKQSLDTIPLTVFQPLLFRS